MAEVETPIIKNTSRSGEELSPNRPLPTVPSLMSSSGGENATVPNDGATHDLEEGSKLEISSPDGDVGESVVESGIQKAEEEAGGEPLEDERASPPESSDRKDEEALENTPSSPPTEETNDADQETTEQLEQEIPLKRQMSKEEEEELDNAFQETAAGSGVIPPPPAEDPPPPPPESEAAKSVVSEIPNPIVTLRLLRKFARKTRPKISTVYGGTQSRSIIRYFFGAKDKRQETSFAPYKTLMDIIIIDGNDRDDEDSSHEEGHEERVVPATDPELTTRAKRAIAAFIDLFAVWSHASSALEKNAAKAFQPFQLLVLETASNLVDYGCLNDVTIQLEDDEESGAASMLASSIFNSDMTSERVELASMKFLLGTGCRPGLLRGTYLLQTIRTLYHVYLTTEIRSNKVTARAALQQLTMSVFARVVMSSPTVDTVVDTFPSADHRDAFLVLRALCKLSMRTLPNSEMTAHIGLQASASNDTWGDSLSAANQSHTLDRKSDHTNSQHAELIYTSAIHPALESKLLALELILYVLQKTNFSNTFVREAGTQFHVMIRNYLCVALLKNCTSNTTRVVSLSLSIFIPMVRHFRTILKNEIEAFVTNVFFVILDSKNSSNEHKSLVVRTFQEIGSDPQTLAEIFLNYDCDLSAVDLFHRIVNTLSKLSRLQEPTCTRSLLGGPSEAQMEKARTETRELRLAAMKALRQILASLHASIVKPMDPDDSQKIKSTPPPKSPQQNLVELYGSKKKRRAEESEVILRFNQKPKAGIAYAAKCGHIDADDPSDVARYLLKHKDEFDKTQIGELLGREAEHQNGFAIKVLHEYVRLMDFTGLVFDDAIRFFLSGFRLPGEAQKIDRIMEKFAERFTEQNPSVFPTADVAFILSFSIIMLNTDLHNPAIKEERRMTKEGFIRNNRGICDGQDLPEEMLTSIFDRIKSNPISLKEDDEARERAGETKKTAVMGLPAALSPASFFSSHYEDDDRTKESNFQKEREHIVRTTETILKRRKGGSEKPSSTSKRSSIKGRQPSRFVLSEDSGLKDEYVSPMFEVTWGPALASFSTAMESANGTAGALIAIASDEELELAAENAAETIEVCLTGFRFAIGIAGLCGNSVARDAYMLGLSRFSQLGTGVLLEPRHIRCVQTMLSLAREDGELLGLSWEHVFKALSEINRFHQLFHMLARNDRAAAMAAERRRRRLEEKERRRVMREEQKAASEDGESLGGRSDDNVPSESDDDDSLAESGLFSAEIDFDLDEDMDAKEIDEANAREIYDAVSESTIEAIYERSSSLSPPAVKEFVMQLCMVSRAEMSVGGPEGIDLNQVSYRQKHALLNGKNAPSSPGGDQFHHTQPNIYNLQKLVEVTHYNMASRPRLLFAELWVIVADHLTDTALNSNPAIAMYAVDSFRQLSIQYLKRDELEVFEFQRRFLKPLETVMTRSDQSSTKELLLNCVARLMHVFGASGYSSGSVGGLRSGWVPILTILGTGGCDVDEGIAQMSFKTLSNEIKHCLHDEAHSNLLLNEYFVETVNAVLMIIGGPHDEICLLAIDQIMSLADALATGSFSEPQSKKKLMPEAAPEHTTEDSSKQKLGLWWPILLGLSRCIGDAREAVQRKSLEALFEIISGHFVTMDGDSSPETLQLIFRGILNSVLEFAEAPADVEASPNVPDDFEFLIMDPNDRDPGSDHGDTQLTWLDTIFEPFMDACIALCKRSMQVFNDTVVVDEVFALINTCLLSDSGGLAVHGLRRLEQFVTCDLEEEDLTDDVWATVSHMLQRCLSVRGLPKKPSRSEIEGMSEEVIKEKESEYDESIREFTAEDRYLPHRRFIGSNATSVIGALLCSERFAIALRWRLFLVKWLHRAVREWEVAAEILNPINGKAPRIKPDYRETALYGRKWINRLILQLIAIPEIAEARGELDPKSPNRFLQGQKQVMESTESMLNVFVHTEEAISQNRKFAKTYEMIYRRHTTLVQELLSGYGSMDADYLKKIAWISPVLLSSCIRSKNEEIRLLVQKVVDKTSPASATVKTPPAPQANSTTEDIIDEETDAVLVSSMKEAQNPEEAERREILEI